MTVLEKTHCRLEYGANGIAWLELDLADSATNTLPLAMLRELRELLEDLAAHSGLRGVIIRSAKSAGFVSGANVGELRSMYDTKHVQRLMQLGHDVTGRIASLPVPTVAAIHGHCIGSGLELALACRYRVADRAAATSLGLPDVRLGLHPCFGATARLPLVVGSWRALELLTSGRSVDAGSALAYGLVDATVPADDLMKRARDLLTRDPGPHRSPIMQRLVRFPPVNWVVYRFLDSKLQREANPENFPATYAILKLWVRTSHQRLPQRLAAERTSLLTLIQKPSALNLVRTYLLQERVKGEARRLDVQTPQHVHIVGTGTIGAGLAGLLVLHGRRVSLCDTDEQAMASAVRRVKLFLEQRLQDASRVADSMSRLLEDPKGDAVGDADFVIESIPDDSDAKLALYRELEPRMREGVPIATTTATVLIEDLLPALEMPGRLVGLHCFNPVERMPLIEVVVSRQSNAQAVDQAEALVVGIDKLPLRVRSAPGYLVNRLQLPYMLKGAEIYDRARREVIDAAAMDFGLPIGPLEQADAVGLDVCVALAERLERPVPDTLRDLVNAGHVGMRSGKGFHDWKHGRRVTASVPPGGERDFPALVPQLVTPILEEAARCRDEGVVTDPDLVDLGALFGGGFPAYTGGPLMLREQWQRRPPEYKPRFRKNTL